jgi:hypothetical protein
MAPNALNVPAISGSDADFSKKMSNMLLNFSYKKVFLVRPTPFSFQEACYFIFATVILAQA